MTTHEGGEDTSMETRPRYIYRRDGRQGKRRARQGKLREDSLSIYTAGSVIFGEIRFAATCPLMQQTRAVYMGTETTSTVYAACQSYDSVKQYYFAIASNVAAGATPSTKIPIVRCRKGQK